MMMAWHRPLPTCRPCRSWPSNLLCWCLHSRTCPVYLTGVGRTTVHEDQAQTRYSFPYDCDVTAVAIVPAFGGRWM